MGKLYRLSPLAEADLEKIWLYTFKHWSKEQADIYYSNFVAAFEGLATGSSLGITADILPNFKKYLCGSHVIYFQDYPDHLDIIRILHQQQDAERHL